jgi:hypothetical protein
MLAGARVEAQQPDARKPRSSFNLVPEPVYQTENRWMRNFEFVASSADLILANRAYGPSGHGGISIMKHLYMAGLCVQDLEARRHRHHGLTRHVKLHKIWPAVFFGGSKAAAEDEAEPAFCGLGRKVDDQIRESYSAFDWPESASPHHFHSLYRNRQRKVVAREGFKVSDAAMGSHLLYLDLGFDRLPSDRSPLSCHHLQLARLDVEVHSFNVLELGGLKPRLDARAHSGAELERISTCGLVEPEVCENGHPMHNLCHCVAMQSAATRVIAKRCFNICKPLS